MGGRCSGPAILSWSECKRRVTGDGGGGESGNDGREAGKITGRIEGIRGERVAGIRGFRPLDAGNFKLVACLRYDAARDEGLPPDRLRASTPGATK